MQLISLLLFVVPLLSTDLHPKINESIIEQTRAWVRFKLAMSGGKAPYSYFYDEYPIGWNPVFDYIYVPNNKLVDNRRYPLKIRVKDDNQSVWSGTVIVENKKGTISLNSQVYLYDHKFPMSFFNEKQFSGKEQTVVNQLTVRQLGTQYAPIKSQTNTNILTQLTGLSSKPGSVNNQVASLIDNPEQISEDVKIDVPESLANYLRKSRLGYRDFFETSYSYGGTRYQKNTKTTNIQNIREEPEAQSTTKSSEQMSTKIAEPQTQIDDPVLKHNQTPTTNKTPTNNQPVNILNDQTQSTLLTPIDDIFRRLPTQQQLDTIILTSDSVSILKTLQNVIQSNLKCTDKIYYLQDFLGRISSAIEMKDFTASQLKVIIQGASKEIERLSLQIVSHRQEIQALPIQVLKQKLNTQLLNLQETYNKFNSVQIQIKPERAKIAGHQNQISNIRQSSIQYRNLLAEQQLKIVETDNDIARLQAALKNARDKKLSLLQNIQTIKSKISQFEKQLESNMQKIQSIEKFIDTLQSESDIFKIKSKTLEVGVERLQKDLVQVQAKQDKIQSRILNIQEKIRLQKLKLATDQLQNLNVMVTSLKDAVPSVEEEIDRFNFECLQLSISSQKNQNNVLIFKLGQKDYSQYIQEIYGDVSLIQTKTSLEFSAISILSPLWKSAFGNPFASSQIANRDQFSFGGDFNCLEPSKLISGVGRIRHIRQRQIFVEVNVNGIRREVELNLGACSRLETTSQTPKIGQSIYWKGVSASQRVFDVYRATCL